MPRIDLYFWYFMFQIPEQFGPVRAITEGRGSQLIVGTTKNCILAGSFQLPFQPVVQGHTDELVFCFFPMTKVGNPEQGYYLLYYNLFIFQTLGLGRSPWSVAVHYGRAWQNAGPLGFVVTHCCVVFGLWCKCAFLSNNSNYNIHPTCILAQPNSMLDNIQEAAQSVCFSPDGSVIVVGTVLGHWFAISAETREILSHHNDGSEPIQVLSFVYLSV